MTSKREWSDEQALDVLAIIAVIAALISSAGWITHIVICIRDGQWLLLIAGIVAFPVGVIHGVGHWFGAW